MRTTTSAEGRRRETKPEENIKKSLFYDVVHLTPLVIHFETKRKQSSCYERSARRFIVNAWYNIWEMSQECQTLKDLIVLSSCVSSTSRSIFYWNIDGLFVIYAAVSRVDIKLGRGTFQPGVGKWLFRLFGMTLENPIFYCLWSRTGFNDHVGINDIIKVLKHAIWFINLPDYY